MTTNASSNIGDSHSFGTDFKRTLAYAEMRSWLIPSHDQYWSQSSTGSRESAELEKRGFHPYLTLECPVGGFPTFENNQMVNFVTHITSGLVFLPSSFLLSVLAFYGLELCILNSSTIVQLSVFVTLCECWLGIALDLDLFW